MLHNTNLSNNRISNFLLRWQFNMRRLFLQQETEPLRVLMQEIMRCPHQNVEAIFSK